jgi:hypothetical protein
MSLVVISFSLHDAYDRILMIFFTPNETSQAYKLLSRCETKFVHEDERGKSLGHLKILRSTTNTMWRSRIQSPRKFGLDFHLFLLQQVDNANYVSQIDVQQRK